MLLARCPAVNECMHNLVLLVANTQVDSPLEHCVPKVNGQGLDLHLSLPPSLTNCDCVTSGIQILSSTIVGDPDSTQKLLVAVRG